MKGINKFLTGKHIGTSPLCYATQIAYYVKANVEITGFENIKWTELTQGLIHMILDGFYFQWGAGIATRYRPDGSWFERRWGKEIFSFLQRSRPAPGDRPAPCTMGIGAPSRGQSGHPPPPHLAPKFRWGKAAPHLHLCAFKACYRDTFTLYVQSGQAFGSSS
jgi:hypothetical protein